MKRIVYPFIAIIGLTACESDNEGEQTCTNRLWNLSETCDNTQSPPACNWLATYGETQATATTVQVDEDTYEYYIGKGNVHNGSICWEGTQD